jgi:hypothetical protein
VEQTDDLKRLPTPIFMFWVFHLIIYWTAKETSQQITESQTFILKYNKRHKLNQSVYHYDHEKYFFGIVPTVWYFYISFHLIGIIEIIYRIIEKEFKEIALKIPFIHYAFKLLWWRASMNALWLSYLFFHIWVAVSFCLVSYSDRKAFQYSFSIILYKLPIY